MKLVLVSLAFIVAVVSFDQLGRWMERRGWLYYRNGRGRRAMGNALLEMQELIEPDRKSFVEVLEEERPDEAAQGDPPEVLDAEDSRP